MALYTGGGGYNIMGDESQNGWDQYSKLVLKELEVLGASVTALREEINGLREVISEMKGNTTHTLNTIAEIKVWKEKLDEVISPTQLLELIIEVEKLKDFKTKAVTVFVVVQFGITAFIAFSQYF